MTTRRSKRITFSRNFVRFPPEAFFPVSQPASPQPIDSPSLLQRWTGWPLYQRILGGVLLGLLVGLLLGKSAAPLKVPSDLILRLLGALAPPLVLLAVVQALMHAHLPRGTGLKLACLLGMNTLVAIFIGLAVANMLQPGKWSLSGPDTTTAVQSEKSPDSTVEQHVVKQPVAKDKFTEFFDHFLENVPRSLLGPLTDQGKAIAVIMLGLAFGVALRRFKDHKLETVADFVEVCFQALITILHWIIEVIPLAVFGVVAGLIGTKGFTPFEKLGGFVVAVLLALVLQTLYYLAMIRLRSWVRPRVVLEGMRDALVMAFSTGSSTATMPVTFDCLRHKIGLRERSASLGALVGANFNNDGTALYEAMSALFIAQMLGMHLSLQQQLMVVLTSVIASVGAAGIPEAGLTTMTLVFTAVGLPIENIPLLLTVDWFLDRCRTTVNVMGDVSVSCLLDGKVREEQAVPAAG